MDTETLTYFDRKFLELKTDIKEDIKSLEVIVNNTCTKLAGFDVWRETVDKRCNSRGDDVKKLADLEGKFNLHVQSNGNIAKDIKDLKEEVKPFSEWKTTGRTIMAVIIGLMVIFSFYKTVRETFSQPKTTTTIGVTK